MGRRIWLNGLFKPESEAAFSVYDSAAMYGDSLFEMMRSFNKQPFKLEAHLNRLLDSCKFTEMPLDYNFWQLKRGHEDLLNANRYEFSPDDEYRSFINVSRGPLPIYKDILEAKPWVMMTVYPLKWVLKGLSRFYTVGKSAVIVSQPAIPSRFMENKVKNHCRLSSRLAEQEAKRSDPDAWPILVDDQGYLTESTGANCFLVKRDRLLTPEPRNCLRGISRNFVLQLARTHSIEYRERNLERYDALTADEAFFTATPFCIMPCTKINGQSVGTSKVGKLTSFLMDKWKETVNCDFVEQAEGWSDERK